MGNGRAGRVGGWVGGFGVKYRRHSCHNQRQSNDAALGRDDVGGEGIAQTECLSCNSEWKFTATRTTIH